MTQPKDIEGLRKVAEEALGCADIKVTYDSVGRQYTHIANSAEVAASIIRLVCAPLLSELEAVKGERDEALKLMSEYARKAGEATGRLEMSEAAGIVDGWRERAEAAEAALVSLKGGGGSSGGGVQAAPDGATEAQHSAGYKGVRLYTRRIEGGAGAHVIVEMERADGASVEAIREYADISDSIIDHWARLPRPEEGK